MKKIIVIFIFSIAITSVVCLAISSKKRTYVKENIEALTENEEGGIQLDFCYKSEGYGTFSGYICAEGTPVYFGNPYVGGTIYPCSNESKVSLLSEIGYCYVKKE